MYCKVMSSHGWPYDLYVYLGCALIDLNCFYQLLCKNHIKQQISNMVHQAQSFYHPTSFYPTNQQPNPHQNQLSDLFPNLYPVLRDAWFLGFALSPRSVCPLVWTSNFFDNLSRSIKLASYQHSHLQIWSVITSQTLHIHVTTTQQSFPSSPSHLIAVLTLLFSPTVLMHKPI